MKLDRQLSASAAAIALIALIAGCNSGESQSTAAKDVATASQDAAQDVAKAREDAARDMSGAARELTAEQRKVNDVAAHGAYDVEMAKAEGDHKVATEKCGTLVSDALKACTSQADADFDTAKARAKATLDAA